MSSRVQELLFDGISVQGTPLPQLCLKSSGSEICRSRACDLAKRQYRVNQHPQKPRECSQTSLEPFRIIYKQGVHVLPTEHFWSICQYMYRFRFKYVSLEFPERSTHRGPTNLESSVHDVSTLIFHIIQPLFNPKIQIGFWSEFHPKPCMKLWLLAGLEALPLKPGRLSSDESQEHSESKAAQIQNRQEMGSGAQDSDEILNVSSWGAAPRLSRESFQVIVGWL